VGGTAGRQMFVQKLFDGVPVKLAFVAISESAQPHAAAPFDVVVGAQDALGNAQPVAASTTVTLTRDDGADIFFGAKSCTLATGQTACVVTGALLITRGVVTIKAAVTSGPALSSVAQQLYIAPALVSVAIVSHTPAVTRVGDPVTVTFSVTGSSSVQPTGQVVVSDGVYSCYASLPLTSCTLVAQAAGARQLVAQYSGDATYDFALSPAVVHNVDPLLQMMVPLVPAGPTVMTLSGGGATCTFVSANALPASSWPQLTPGMSVPYGAFHFRVDGCAQGSTLHLALAFPFALPPIAQFVYHDDNTFTASYGQAAATVSGNVISFDIVDGGPLDRFGDGVLSGIGGVAIMRDTAVGSTTQSSAQPIPVGGFAWLAALALAVGLIALRLNPAARAR
jgi:hypothetical protein